MGCLLCCTLNASEKILRFEDGSVYVGSVLNNLPNGLGALYQKNGNITYGNWLRGVIDQSKQVCQYKEGIALVGKKSHGVFIDDLIAYFQDGSKYIIKKENQDEEIFQKIKIIRGVVLQGDKSSINSKIQKTDEIKLQQAPPKYLRGKNKIYELKQKVGQGGFGSIFHYEAQGKFKGLKRPFAAKYDSKSKSQQNQAKILNLIRDYPHKNVITFEEATSTQGRTYLIMEYCQGNLLQIIPFLRSKILILFHIYELIKSLVHLHQNACYHRDIKPGNILVTFLNKKNPFLITLKYCDFGISQHIGDLRPITSFINAWTKDYMSPQKGKGKVDEAKSDIWSLGIVFIQMMSRRILYDKYQSLRVYSSESQQKLKDFISGQLPSQFNNDKILKILCSMLNYDPIQRPSAQKVAQLLQDLPQFCKSEEIHKKSGQKDKEASFQLTNEDLRKQLQKNWEKNEKQMRGLQRMNQGQKDTNYFDQKVAKSQTISIKQQKKKKKQQQKITQQHINVQIEYRMKPIPLKEMNAEEQVHQSNLQELVLHKLQKKSWHELQQLMWINLGSKQLVQIPDKLCTLKELEQLYLYNNLLKFIPESIGLLINLKQLYLQNNKLKAIPQTVCYLVKLQHLYLSNNLLNQLPQSLKMLKSLQCLKLQKNPHLKSFPTFIEELKSLKKMDFDISLLPTDEFNSKSFAQLKDLTLWIYYKSLSESTRQRVQKQAKNKKFTLLFVPST